MDKSDNLGNCAVSVIVPIYNCERYLEQCIRSIQKQTFNGIEIILIDDGSTDASGTICDTFANENSNIRVVHTDNCGAAAARRKGIIQAAGEYILFVDADDWVETDYVETLFSLASSEQADAVICAIKHFSNGKYYVDKAYFECGFYSKERLNKTVYPQMLSGEPFYCFGISPSMCGKLFRRGLARRNLNALNTGLTMGEDGCFTYSALLDCNSLYITEKSGYVYRQNENSATHCFRARVLAEGTIIHAFYSQLAVDKHWNVGKQIDEYMAFLCNSTVCEALTSSYMEEQGARSSLIKYINETFPRSVLQNEKLKTTSLRNKVNFFLMRHRMLYVLSLLLKLNGAWRK